jgi:hypothetical protein
LLELSKLDEMTVDREAGLLLKFSPRCVQRLFTRLIEALRD